MATPSITVFVKVRLGNITGGHQCAHINKEEKSSQHPPLAASQRTY
jgi:hypothetical protein